MSNFFAMVSRMRLIDRWALMQNTAEENIAEHSHNVAVIAHALCVIGNKKFGKTYNAERCALLALYHDTTEVITGDMPTPVKYGSEEMKNVYKNVEALAGERLLAMLPEEFRDDYAPLFEKQENDKELWKLVKAADKIDALIKCINETRMGNREFEKALDAQEKLIDEINMPEVDYFKKEFLPAYYLTLDEHTKR
ncbi:MAG TPA: 5'-deoxynucleotidase [Candidatus Eubacterium faecipullorum]|uniref:5'-deoxynucleotidase n=1 Tax=Candidatus Eubacterium faecipullorum TaxID=2838571 RepID=A0A9D1RCH0_9FIRM|nr:5'-deoxynucleotidase [Candidatus Eubacterium faecipullorum]